MPGTPGNSNVKIEMAGELWEHYQGDQLRFAAALCAHVRHTGMAAQLSLVGANPPRLPIGPCKVNWIAANAYIITFKSG